MILPRHALAKITGGFQNSGFSARPSLFTQEKMYKLCKGSLSSSGINGQSMCKFFENYSSRWEEKNVKSLHEDTRAVSNSFLSKITAKIASDD